jgi:hypothetical protein
VRPPPLLMIGVTSFTLALLLFSLALVAPYGPPPWQWALNGVAIVYGLWSAAYWYRQANR